MNTQPSTNQSLSQAEIDALFSPRMAELMATKAALERLNNELGEVDLWAQEAATDGTVGVYLLNQCHLITVKRWVVPANRDNLRQLVDDIAQAFTACLIREKAFVLANPAALLTPPIRKLPDMPPEVAPEQSSQPDTQEGELWLTKEDFAGRAGIEPHQVSAFATRYNIAKRKGEGRAKLYRYINHKKGKKWPQQA